MSITPIIFGSTGMVGKGVLYECFENPKVESVLVINRQPLGIQHKKLKEIVRKDLYDLSPIADQLAGYNACFFCLGVSAAGLNEKEYHKITYDLTTKTAETLLKVNKDMVFCYVSGAGTDSTGKSSMMWARVKGKTENALLAMPFKKAYMFRPGYIQPLKGIRSKTAWYNLFYFFLKPLYFLLKPLKSFITDTTSVGITMIHAASKGYNKQILESKDINELANK